MQYSRETRVRVRLRLYEVLAAGISLRRCDSCERNLGDNCAITRSPGRSPRTARTGCLNLRSEAPRRLRL